MPRICPLAHVAVRVVIEVEEGWPAIPPFIQLWLHFIMALAGCITIILLCPLCLLGNMFVKQYTCDGPQTLIEAIL